MAKYGREGAIESIKLKLMLQKEMLINRTMKNLAVITDTERFSDEYDLAQNENIERVTSELNNRDNVLLNKVNNALDRFMDGTFGVCEECGDTIPTARLMAEPTTKLCVECQSREEQSERFYNTMLQRSAKRLSA